MRRRLRNSGQAMLVMVLLFLVAGTIIVTGTILPIAAQIRVSRGMVLSASSYYLANAAAEDAVFRLSRGKAVATGDTLSLNGGTATVSVSALPAGRSVTATADVRDRVRKVKATLALGVGASFNYGVQVGEGGFSLSNTSSIVGNVYSNGPIVGSNSNVIYGDVVSAGSAGRVEGVHATSSIYARTIVGSVADKDAYYASVTDTRASGSLCPNSHCHPGSADQPAIALPISDEMIEQWQNDAAAGGTATCSGGSYSISGGNVTLGPKKIPCNLNISGTNTTVTLAGALWVVGNITVSNQPVIRVDPSLSGRSVPVVADNPANRTSSSAIYLSNGTAGEVTFQGSGTNSYILFVSRNTSAEQGGSNAAIAISNSVNGDALVYAGHGLVTVSNSITIKELTAYKVQSSNTARVIYNTGLASLLFASGPGGGYDVTGWEEVE